jgi:hypothetical protein
LLEARGLEVVPLKEAARKEDGPFSREAGSPAGKRSRETEIQRKEAGDQAETSLKEPRPRIEAQGNEVGGLVETGKAETKADEAEPPAEAIPRSVTFHTQDEIKLIEEDTYSEAEFEVQNFSSFSIQTSFLPKDSSVRWFFNISSSPGCKYRIYIFFRLGRKFAEKDPNLRHSPHSPNKLIFISRFLLRRLISFCSFF